MINYGGSITSAFPNTLCSSPSSFTCNLCNLNLHENDSHNQKSYQKCTHCGVNICENCLIENQEICRGHRQDLSEDKVFSRSKNCPNNRSILHYNVVKKEFKQMYNYSKAIIEKLHLLNNTIKTEESTISELNMIKHQVNTKALELIKQINQEKQELLDQIENTKRKYESALNDRKEYFALSMQYKDELRKVIRRYKEFKADEKCSLSDLLNLYFSVKTISKNLDDYDHIKLAAEQETIQLKFDERPIFRNLIGKIVPNQSKTNSSNVSIESKNCDNNETDTNIRNSFEKNGDCNKNEKLNHLLKSHENDLNKDLSRSFSLNDLINAANELITSKENDFLYKQKNRAAFLNNLEKSKYVNKSTPIICVEEKKNKTFSFSEFNTQSTEEEILSRKNKLINENAIITNKTNLDKTKAVQPPPPPPPMSQSLTNNLKFNSTEILDYKNGQNFKLKSVSKTSMEIDYKQNVNVGKKLNKSVEELNASNLKIKPKQRLEIDILPSYLSCSKNKLLIASSHGKIRILDLFTYKIQKDELKNLLINGIGMPKSVDDSNFLYAVTNAQMNGNEDVLNVSNSVIIVSKRELKVLKIENNDPSEDYVFSNPSGICYDIYENLYICDSGNNRVKIMDRSLSVIKIIEAASNSQDLLSQPKSVATHQDLLFICDSSNHRIVVYQILDQGKDFKFKNVYGYGYGDDYGKLKYPLECCVDSKGVLYVRDHHNNRVQVFDTDGTPLPLIEVNSQRETIYSMTVNDNGDIYLAKIVHSQDQDKYGKMNTFNKYYIDIY